VALHEKIILVLLEMADRDEGRFIDSFVTEANVTTGRID
jgi:hypothetical protein